MTTIPTGQDNVVAAKLATSHGKLHKRGGSVSSPKALLPADLNAARATDRTKDAPTSSREFRPDLYRGAVPTSKSKTYIDSLKRLSAKDTNTIDLSRSAAENEFLTGLGILNHGPAGRFATDVSFTPVGKRAMHNRSTSLTSQFSTASSSYRPPLRLTPRPYTPPSTVQDHASTVGSSQFSLDGVGIPEEGLRPRSYHSASMSSMHTTPQLHVNASASSAPATGVIQTNGTSRPASIRRLRRDTTRSSRSIETFNTASPSSRTSLDKAFSRIRGRETESEDPALRAASIRAARQAFTERQEAKDRRAEKEALNAREKHNRKLEKREAWQRGKSDASQQRPRAQSTMKENEKLDYEGFQPGRSYEELKPAHTMSLPLPVGEKAGWDGLREGRSRGRTDTGLSKKRKVKSRYLRFLIWLKTRLLRLGRG